VYPSTIVGIPPQEDAWIGKATERIFLAPIKMTLVPEIIDMEMPVEGVFHNLVIAKIKKEYAGQAQKVMNAMWGAGQMMFNKILVVVDQGADIHDYLELARHVFTHLRPASDIYFSQGPMDVLDHSCSKLGFGGKMCIDGTAKFEEEQLTKEPAAVDLPEIDVAALRAAYPEIAAVNADLLPLGIPCVFIAVEKNKKGHVRELSDALFGSPEISKIKVILFVEHTVDVSDVADTLWRFCNNLDPKRDHFISGDHIGFDGTRKTAEFDDFHRDWPNIIVSDAETISAVDKKWVTLGLGPFIKSPSLKYRDQIYGEGASVE
jgi:4-hydroxy-3-polyprenylbenzoate decarboxylase